jgi:hypothetical protein
MMPGTEIPEHRCLFRPAHFSVRQDWRRLAVVKEE